MLEWKDETHLVVDGLDLIVDGGVRPTEARGHGDLIVRKPRWMIDRYDALASIVDTPNVVELGIWEGGSTALLTQLLRPRRLVAIDLSPTRVAALDDFIDSRDLTQRIRPYFGVDQADRSRLGAIVADEFGSEPLDVVIDDASHLLPESTVSFNLLFPRLRPGGWYVIEDWSSELERERGFATQLRSNPALNEAFARRLETEGVPAPPEPPLGRLVLELVLAAGYADGAIAQISELRGGWAVVQRGSEPSTRTRSTSRNIADRSGGGC